MEWPFPRSVVTHLVTHLSEGRTGGRPPATPRRQACDVISEPNDVLLVVGDGPEQIEVSGAFLCQIAAYQPLYLHELPLPILQGVASQVGRRPGTSTGSV